MKRIYFLRPVGQLGPIKIGCSINPDLRLETYMPWSPVRLELIATAPGSHAAERQLHGMFADHWMHHEWFAASKKLLALLDHVLEFGELPELPKVYRFPVRTTNPRAWTTKTGPTKKTLHFGNLVRPEYENGATAEDIGERYGRPASAVIRALKAVGVEIRRGRPLGKIGPQDSPRAEAMAVLYNSGKTLAQVGAEFGVTKERVRQLLRSYGVPSLGHRKGIRPKKEPTTIDFEIVRRWKAGETARQLRAEYPNVRIEAAIYRAGTERFKMKAAAQRADEKAQKIAAAYRAGASARDIAKDYGLAHKETVYRYLKRAGEPVRRASA